MDFRQLMDVFLLPANLLIVGATISVLVAAKRMFPNVTEHHIYARLEPMLPLLVATGLVFLPREAVDKMLIGDRIILGIVLGMGAAVGFKTWHTSVMGNDERIKQPEPPKP